MPLRRWRLLREHTHLLAANICSLANVISQKFYNLCSLKKKQIVRDEKKEKKHNQIKYQQPMTVVGMSIKDIYLYVSSSTPLISSLKYRSIPNLWRLSTIER